MIAKIAEIEEGTPEQEITEDADAFPMAISPSFQACPWGPAKPEGK
jgi:hypothetical protein